MSESPEQMFTLDQVGEAMSQVPLDKARADMVLDSLKVQSEQRTAEAKRQRRQDLIQDIVVFYEYTRGDNDSDIEGYYSGLQWGSLDFLGAMRDIEEPELAEQLAVKAAATTFVYLKFDTPYLSQRVITDEELAIIEACKVNVTDLVNTFKDAIKEDYNVVEDSEDDEDLKSVRTLKDVSQYIDPCPEQYERIVDPPMQELRTALASKVDEEN